jgi:hypothetical protein
MARARIAKAKLADPPTEQLPPHSTEAERAAIGCVLLAGEAGDAAGAAKMLGELRRGLFYTLAHREIFDALVTTQRAGRIPDVLTLRQELIDAGRLDELGGTAFVSGLPDSASSQANFPSYADVLKEKTARRELLLLGTEACRIAYDPAVTTSAAAADFRDVAERILGGTAGPNPWTELLTDGADIVRRELPPVVQIVEGIIGERSKLVIGSGSKSFKTWVTIHLALCIAHGIKFLDRAVTRRPILYVNLELKTETFERRVQTIAKHQGIEVQPAWFVHLPLRGKLSRLTTHDIIDRIIRLARQTKAAVVIIDPIYKLNQGEENSSRDQTILFNELDRLTTEAECSVILNDHFGKGNQSEKDPLDAIRGSSVKGGDVDAAMILRKHELDDVFRVDMVHRELPPVEPFCISWQFPCFIARPDLNPENMKKAGGGRKPDHKAHDLLKPIMESTAEHPVSVSAWAKAANISRQTLQGYLPSLRSKGWIATSGEGSAARQYVTDTGKQAVKEWGDS